MTSPSISAPSQPKVALWAVLLLLVASVSINYVDRGNLSIAAPLLKDELAITPSQLGILLSSFFWTYSVFQVVSGWLVDRFDVNWIIAGGFLLWSVATAATGLIRGFAVLIVLRLVLGIGESVAFPRAPARLRQLADRCRHQMRPGPGDFGRRPADGSLWMALVFHRSRIR
jgi:MFS family permease